MFEQTKREISKARRIIGLLEGSGNYEDAELFWCNFLDSINKVGNKLEHEILSLQHANKYNGIISKYRNDIKRDPLISYMRNARGADTHTVQVISQKAQEVIIGGPGVTIINTLRIENGEILECDIPVGNVQIIERLMPIPFTNKGKEFLTPAEHMGDMLDCNVGAFAWVTLKYYEKLLDDAENIGGE